MSYSPVLTLTRLLSEAPDDMYTLSAYDMEHFGILVQATRVSDKTELCLNVTDGQRIRSGVDKSVQGYTLLLESIELEVYPKERILQSNLPTIPRNKRNISADEVEDIIKAPSQSSTSLHEVLVRGLVELCKVKPVGNDAVQWLGEWLLDNNPNQPRVAEH